MEAFDDLFRWCKRDGDVHYGMDVLDGLIEGIEQFASGVDERRRTSTSALIGSTMWFDDPALRAALRGLTSCCIVMRKQSRSTSKRTQLKDLARTTTDIPPLPIRAFPRLRSLRPTVEGHPQIVGPYDAPLDDFTVGPIRTIGFRKSSSGKMVPILHAKLALLGRTWWGEDDWGTEVQGFTPARLWISSANFTQSSRKSLEFGLWTEDPEALSAAQTFLETIVCFSEGIDPFSDDLAPDLEEPEFDVQAFAETLSEWDVARSEMESEFD